MKKTFFIYSFIFICILSLTAPSCTPSGVAVNDIKNAINNLDNCLANCSTDYAKAMEGCLQGHRAEFDAAVNVCIHSTGTEEQKLACIGAAFQKIVDQCKEELKKLEEEKNKCRKECRDKFPLELKIE